MGQVVGARLLLAWLLLACLGLLSPGPGRAAEPEEKPFARGASHIKSWRFRLDPTNQGEAAGWREPTFDDSGWLAIDLSTQKDEWNRLRFDGVAWYRAWLDRPPAPSTLVLFGIDTPYQLFVDGQAVAVRRVPQGKYADRMGIVELPAGGRTLLAIRVSDAERAAGALADARVGRRLSALLEPPEALNLANREHPEWMLPSWVEEWTEPSRRTAWTMVGLPGAPRKALVSLDGAISPRNPSYTVTPWLIDERTLRLHAPHEGPGTATRLRQGHLPIVEQSWRAGSLLVASTTFVADPDPIAQHRYVVSNEGTEPASVALYLSVRGYDVRGGAVPIRSIGYAPAWRSVVVDDELALQLDRAPDGFGATSLPTEDVSAAALRGALPDRFFVRDDDGYAQALLRYRWRIEPGARETLTLTFPVDPLPASADVVEHLNARGFLDDLTRVEQRWRDRLHGVELKLPEQELVDAFYASLAYLLIAQTGDRFHPGPLFHNSSWTRDTAYMGLALNRMGMGDRVRPALDRLLAMQRPSGELPAIVDADGTPRPVSEWDAQGQTIFAVATYARYTGDRAYLVQVYPQIRAAADFLIAVRARDPAGILPPSLSAEDLGSEHWHHYWDDFWGLSGLREAAAVARTLEETADAARWENEERALRERLLVSIRAVQRQHGIRHIPNGPEDVGASSDARGTNPAVWPLNVLPGEEPLLRESFEHYFVRWIEPQGGGYRHALGLAWPYGGLGLAQGFLRLGMTDHLWTVIDWTLRNQTVPGAFAWAEGVHPQTGSFQVGDMPHGWAAAELINLLRDVLITEQDDRLLLGSGIPRRWLTANREIRIEDAPTPFGVAGYAVTPSLATRSDGVLVGTVLLERRGGARPPGGYRLALPFDQPPRRVVVDGAERPAARVLDLSADFSRATLYFE